MAQNKSSASGCATGIVRTFGGLLLIFGLGNLFAFDVGSGIVLTIIGIIMLTSGSGGKSKNRGPAVRTAAEQRKAYQEPIRQARQEVSRQVNEAVRMVENRTQERAKQWQPQQQMSPKTAQTCPNPEPHRHFAAVPPVNQVERLVKNRKILYEAGLLTREEYDAEVRKLRGR